MASPEKPAIGVGIDFEEISQTPGYKASNSTLSIDIEPATRELLELFDSFDVSATFFVVSELLEEYDELLADIHERGHEIGSHTVSHPELPSLSSREIRSELRDSKEELERQIGTEISSFRAPTCKTNVDVYRELAAAGYRYSSSVMPSIPVPGFYSSEISVSKQQRIETAEGPITEMPLSVYPRVRLPLSGAWIRLLGRRYFFRGVEQLSTDLRPVLTYSHPWEFVSITDNRLPLRQRYRTGDWLIETYRQLFEKDYQFVSLSELAPRD